MKNEIEEPKVNNSEVRVLKSKLDELPDEFTPVTGDLQVQCIPGIRASIQNSHPNEVQKALARGLIPALKGDGFVLNEDSYLTNDKGQLMLAEMLIYVEKISHYEQRLEEDKRKAELADKQITQPVSDNINIKSDTVMSTN